MKYTILHGLHQEIGAKMGAFAGYDMPLQYQLGPVKEHEWVRNYAGIFDISHMKQLIISGSHAAAFLSYLTPTNFKNSASSLARYTVLTNEQGGIIDDLIVTKFSDTEFFLVVNAACADKDIAWINKHAQTFENLLVTTINDRALLAVQGAKAEQVLSMMVQDKEVIRTLPYMHAIKTHFSNGSEVIISRCGYTGEDGFELSIHFDDAVGLFNAFIAHGFVEPIGLIARDSLRLEMGYPLYGNDLTEEITPIDAGLSWVISKNHQEFIGAETILAQKSNGSNQKRVGIQIKGRGIARPGMKIMDSDHNIIGKLTSAGYAPSLKTSIGQAYVGENDLKTNIFVEIRGKLIEAEICRMPFIKAKTKSE
ncbi:MAG: glycine cleavage system aminomethyltransferase GcvT [Rickettsiales bacterium]|nr:glycine cleavage system aminomethyltransferase GcvT [Rickettsiales bacterium]